MKNKNRNISGFTLVELLVVIAIIGILSTIAVVNLSNARNEAKIASLQASAAITMKSFTLCLTEGGDIYYNGVLRCNAGPGLKAIVEGSVMCSNWSELIWPIIEHEDH